MGEQEDLDAELIALAQQLDLPSPLPPGVLMRRDTSGPWVARVLGAAYDDLLGRIHERRPSVLDAYGATNPAEFFAVATECFFERPAALERGYPDLYSELRRFYRRDPAAIARGEAERA